MKDAYRQRLVDVKNFVIDTPKNFKDMADRFTRVPWIYKATGAAIEATLIASCLTPKDVAPTQKLETGGTNTNSTESNPIPTKTGEEREKETIDSFLKSKPEYEGREMSAINISFPPDGLAANTIVMKATKAESQEIDSFTYSFDGQELQPYDNAIVYTTRTKQDGTTEWVRLAGVWFPTIDDSINTAWYYSPDAFDSSKTEIDFKDKVFGFNSRDTNFLFWPLFDKPYTIQWSDDLANPDSYETWNGNDPFYLSMGIVKDKIAGGALFAPRPIEVEAPLPAEIVTKFAGTGYEPQWNADKSAIVLVDANTKKEVPELSVSPETAEIMRTYKFNNPEGGEEDLTVKVTLDELKNKEMSAWKLENGQWVRKNAIHTDPKTGIETEIDEPMYSDVEKVRLVLAATNAIKEASGGEIPSEYGKLSQDHLFSLITNYHNGTAKFKGLVFDVFFGKDINTLKGYNRIYVKNSKDEYDINTYQYTTFYAYESLNKSGDIALLVIHSLTAKDEYIIDEAQLSDHSLKIPNTFRID